MGYKFNIKWRLDNIEFSFSGYNHRLSNFILAVVKKVIELRDMELLTAFEDARDLVLQEWTRAQSRHGQAQMQKNFDRLIF